MESKTYNKQEILNDIKKGGLKVLNPIGFIIDEICDCLLLDKYVAATTATNLLFEESLKLALIFHDSHGKTLEEANKKANELVDTIKCENLFHRTDIGAKAYRK